MNVDQNKMDYAISEEKTKMTHSIRTCLPEEIQTGSDGPKLGQLVEIVTFWFPNSTMILNHFVWRSSKTKFTNENNNTMFAYAPIFPEIINNRNDYPYYTFVQLWEPPISLPSLLTPLLRIIVYRYSLLQDYVEVSEI